MEILVEAQPDPSAAIASMRIAERTPSSVSQRYPVAGQTPEDAPAGIGAIEERGFIREGSRPRNVPFSYYNDGDELVGFDVEMAEALAEGLGDAVEFIPFRRDELAEGLSKGYFDVAMSGLAMDSVAAYNRGARFPVAYAVASGNTELLRYVDNWIDLTRVSRVLDRHYDRWILGKGAAPESRR